MSANPYGWLEAPEAKSVGQRAENKTHVLTFGRFADCDFGGLERYVFDLSRALQYEVEFTNAVTLRGAAPDLELAGRTVYVRSIGSLGGVPISPGMPFQVHRLHRREPFQIVHLQYPPEPMAHLAATTLPRSVKRVITWHSDVVRQRKLLTLYRPFLKQLLRSADAIILPTPLHLEVSDQLAAAREDGRFFVIPFGVDLARFRERSSAADLIRKRHAGRFLVFAVGRHVYYKGFEYLIRAMRDLPDAAVVLGGHGPLTASLKALACELGIEDRVEFVGRIPDKDLPAYFHAADVFCMPSVKRAEAFGIVQLEAMACGKAVVCCELHNGVTWVNQHGVTGLVVSPGNAGALADALKQLMRDETLRARLGEQGRKRVRGEFSLEAMACATLGVYRLVLEDRSAT